MALSRVRRVSRLLQEVGEWTIYTANYSNIASRLKYWDVSADSLPEWTFICARIYVTGSLLPWRRRQLLVRGSFPAWPLWPPTSAGLLSWSPPLTNKTMATGDRYFVTRTWRKPRNPHPPLYFSHTHTFVKSLVLHFQALHTYNQLLISALRGWLWGDKQMN